MLTYPPTYPTPLHETCWAVARLVEACDFRDLPGDIVATWAGNSGIPCLVVRGPEFLMEFTDPCRKHLLQRVITPGKELDFWGSLFKPTLNVFTPDAWENHRDWCLDKESKVHGKKERAPRYVSYRSICDCTDSAGAVFQGGDELVSLYDGAGKMPSGTLHGHTDRLCTLLGFDNYHADTEYVPEGDEPHAFSTQAVLAEMRLWLTTNVLATF